MAGRIMTEPCIGCGHKGRPYQGLGRCGTCYTRMARQADPTRRERDKAMARRWKAANRDRTRAYDAEHAHRPCPNCGDPMARGYSQCAGCRDTTTTVRRSLIEGMWRDEWSRLEIAEALSTTTNSLNVTMVRMRREGWDLPYRYAVRDGKRVPA